MAERDPQIVLDGANPLRAPAIQAVNTAPVLKRKRAWVKLAAMALVPLLLAAGATWYFYANAHYASTDNAYIQQDKVSISAELTGRIVAVGVRENQHVRADSDQSGSYPHDVK